MGDPAHHMAARILVVDDEKPVLDVLGAMLEALGHAPMPCQAIPEARTLFNEHQHDAVMIDVNLAEGSGIKLLEELTLLSPTTAFIVMSGENRVENPVQALQAGADGYLVKPITMQTLRGEIERVLVRRRQIIARLEDKAVLQQALEDRTRQLLRESGISAAVQRGLIMALCRLAEFRDHETGSHLHRMASYSKIVARALSRQPDYQGIIDDLYVRRLYATAPLHDIGKAGIPDHILLKKGPLTAEERVEMQRHSLIGKQTLETVSRQVEGAPAGQVRMGMDICEFHHEKWDGTGYPHGLAGEAIPLCARIVAIADFYDALSSPRVYRPYAMTHEKICEIIRSESGTHFDPAIVEAFFAAEDEILAVRESRPDTLDDSDDRSANQDEVKTDAAS